MPIDEVETYDDINKRLEEASKGDLLDFKLDGGVSTVGRY